MHERQPIIGIAFSDRVYAEDDARRAAGFYRAALEAQGAEVVLLTPRDAPVALADLDGLLLAGGVDVDPVLYGEAAHPKLGEVDAARDSLEIPLARQAAAAHLPIFGICRGVQVLAVAFGGKLHQDIPSVVPGAGQHSGEGVRHRVRVAPGSRLRDLLDADEVETNSYHHQAVSVVGDGLRTVAESDDGVSEALEGRGETFVLGVQWHPERMGEDPRQQRLFAAFVAAARAFAAR